jgi:hypothetical protein
MGPLLHAILVFSACSWNFKFEAPLLLCLLWFYGHVFELWAQSSIVIIAIIQSFKHVIETLSSKLHCYCSLFNFFALLGVPKVMFQHSSCVICTLEIYVGCFNYWLCFLCLYAFVLTCLSFHLCSWNPCWPFLLLFHVLELFILCFSFWQS